MMAADVTMRAILSSLVGRSDVSVQTITTAIVYGTISVVGTDVLVFSPSGNPAATVLVPFSAICQVVVPGQG